MSDHEDVICRHCEVDMPPGTMLEALRDLHRALHGLWASFVLDTPLRRVAGPRGVEHYQRILHLAQATGAIDDDQTEDH